MSDSPYTDGSCFYCNKPTSSWAGDPGLWPIGFGIDRIAHQRCLWERLNAADTLATRLAAVEREHTQALNFAQQCQQAAREIEAERDALREDVSMLERKLWEQAENVRDYCIDYSEKHRDAALVSLTDNAQAILSDPRHQLAARQRDTALLGKEATDGQ